MKSRKFIRIVSVILSVICVIASIVVSAYRYNWEKVDYSNYTIHISIDDCSTLFKDLSENAEYYDSIFQNNTLSFCKEMHDQYGAVFSFYCFFEWEGFRLVDATNKFKSEFEENSDWLKFNYHAYNKFENLNDIDSETFSKEFEEGMAALINIVGEKSIDDYTRLTFFSGNKDVIDYLISRSVAGFYSADDNRNSYYFDEEESYKLYVEEKYDDINSANFNKTDIRLDYSTNPFKDLMNIVQSNGDKNIEVFTHEWLLTQGGSNNSAIWKIKDVCEFAYFYNLQFGFNYTIYTRR